MPFLEPFITQLAQSTCIACEGAGFLSSSPTLVCDCVCRVIFRTCYTEFRRCQLGAGSTQPVLLERRLGPSGQRHYTWVRRNEDYCADFQMAARQALSPEQYRIFRWHYLLGAPRRLIAQRLGRHCKAVDRIFADIQTTVGRRIADSFPYSIYPPSHYLQSGPHLSVA